MIPHQSSQRFETVAQMRKCIDLPRPGQSVYDECISIAGWLYADTRDRSTCYVQASLDGILIGGTRILSARPDVSDFLSVPHDVPTGFRFLARAATPNGVACNATIQLTASWSSDAQYQIGKVPVRLVPASLRKRPYGEVLFPEQRTVLHRENIYGSGPPVLEPGIEMLHLILSYLSPGTSVVDVGCGGGAYGPVLIAAGHEWTGLEGNPHCLGLVEQRGLPVRKTEAGAHRFPCAEQEFDEAICIEVLEHIEHPRPFLEEVARIVRKRALFSVPNMEVIPYFKDWDAVPWHLLEGDHKNFFTRSSLLEVLAPHFSQVEVFSAIEHPLRTREDVPVHVHLFAVAGK